MEGDMVKAVTAVVLPVWIGADAVRGWLDETAMEPAGVPAGAAVTCADVTVVV